MLTMANVKPGEVVYDLGCGDGRVLIMAARQFGAQAVGVEIDPLRYVWTQTMVTLLGLRGQIKVVYGDLFSKELTKADVVTCYLLQSTNKKLAEKLRRELHPGARVVSNTFTFTGLPLILKDDGDEIYVYRKK
jgi:predicted RNA methylase